jgi:hypothetical protein
MMTEMPRRRGTGADAAVVGHPEAQSQRRRKWRGKFGMCMLEKTNTSASIGPAATAEVGQAAGFWPSYFGSS